MPEPVAGQVHLGAPTAGNADRGRHATRRGVDLRTDARNSCFRATIAGLGALFEGMAPSRRNRPAGEPAGVARMRRQLEQVLSMVWSAVFSDDWSFSAQ